MKVPLAGADANGNPSETLLSEVGPVLLSMFDMGDARVLRLVCREFLEAVRQHQWEDWWCTVSGRRLAAWRASFPRARSAWVCYAEDADLVHLQGLRKLSFFGCPRITGATFVHLRGIHTLDMSFCFGLTDAAFEHLRGIHTLDMSGCTGITDSAFVHLRGIHTLDMSGCTGITDSAFVHLCGIHTLDMSECEGFTDAAFAHLRGINTLIMYGCSSAAVSAARAAQLQPRH